MERRLQNQLLFPRFLMIVKCALFTFFLFCAPTSPRLFQFGDASLCDTLFHEQKRPLPRFHARSRTFLSRFGAYSVSSSGVVGWYMLLALNERPSLWFRSSFLLLTAFSLRRSFPWRRHCFCRGVTSRALVVFSFPKTACPSATSAKYAIPLHIQRVGDCRRSRQIC